VRVEGDSAVIGITDHAQDELGDIVYLDLPEAGRILAQEEPFGEVESVKAVSELFAPVSGEVTESNTGIENSTEVVNDQPYLDGWLIKVRLANPAEVDGLLSPEEYRLFLDSGGH
jgi:glycine cleavage system H protein